MRSWRVFWLALVGLTLAAGAWADSNVRIVRFSLVTGSVQVNLTDGHGWRPALLNAPLVAGEQIKTLGSGRAEIQFEHGSTLRLIPNSQITITKLSLSDSGEFETAARLDAGTAFATLRKEDSKDFQIALSSGTAVSAEGEDSFRIDTNRVEVLDGKAEVASGAAQIGLKKGQEASLGGSALTAVAVSETVDPWTDWSRTRDQFYAAAFQHGIQPGSLTDYVNWGASLPPMPAYTGTGLEYVGTSACPWTMTSGDYKSWCWSDTQGWYLPVGAVTADATAAQDTSDVAQTNAAIAGNTSLGNGSYPVPSPWFDPGIGFFYTGCGWGSGFYGMDPWSSYGGCGFGSPFGPFDPFGFAGAYYPYVPVYVVPPGSGVPATIAALHSPPPRRPGQKYDPAGGSSTVSTRLSAHLGPPPSPLLRTSFNSSVDRPSGIAPSRIGFSGAALQRNGSFGAMNTFRSGAVGASARITAPATSTSATAASRGSAGEFSGRTGGGAIGGGGGSFGGGVSRGGGGSNVGAASASHGGAVGGGGHTGH